MTDKQLRDVAIWVRTMGSPSFYIDYDGSAESLRELLLSDAGQIAIIQRFIKDGFKITLGETTQYMVEVELKTGYACWKYGNTLAEAIIDCAVKYLEDKENNNG